MNTLRLTLHGRVPSKKNGRQLSYRRNKIYNLPSSAYRDWHSVAGMEAIAQSRGRKISGECSCELQFYAPDKRRADLTNKAESVMDLLCDVGIIEDDSWFIIRGNNLRMMGVDYKNPRVDIFLNYE